MGNPVQEESFYGSDLSRRDRMLAFLLGPVKRRLRQRKWAKEEKADLRSGAEEPGEVD